MKSEYPTCSLLCCTPKLLNTDISTAAITSHNSKFRVTLFKVLPLSPLSNVRPHCRSDRLRPSMKSANISSQSIAPYGLFNSCAQQTNQKTAANTPLQGKLKQRTHRL